MAVAERAWHPAGSAGDVGVESSMLGDPGGDGMAAWEWKERSAFSEDAVERPLVPLQNCRVSREERLSTEVPTDPSWKRRSVT